MLALRSAFRQLLHSPAYTSVALLMLALGIGVNSSMFSVLNVLLFQSAPYPEPQQLVQLAAHTPRGTEFDFSAQEVQEIQAQGPDFAALTAYTRTQYVVSGSDRTGERIPAVMATTSLFDTIGLQPLLGRAFTAAESIPGNNQVVVLAHDYWLEKFGGRQDIIGEVLRLSGENVTIIGVAPPTLAFDRLWGDVKVWRPLNYTEEQLQWRDYRAFRFLGRIGPASSPAQIDASLIAVARLQEQEHPESYAGLRYENMALNDVLIDDVGRRISWLLSGLAGFVLLIACANLANLQLARSALRSRELAIRSALGASRRRLITQQLLESVLLSFGGGLAGLGLAWTLNRLIESELLSGIGQSATEIKLEPTVLAWTFGLALLTGLIFGSIPAWISSRTDTNAALKSQARGSSASRGVQRLRQALIVAEITLAMVLLSGAAMTHRGFITFLDHETGWDDNRILAAALPIPADRFGTPDLRNELFLRIEQQLKLLPGVEHAALATSLPIFGYGAPRPVLMEGQTAGDSLNLPSAFHTMVTPEYFDALGIKRVAGQTFAPDIAADDPAVIVINESLARQLWPTENPIGERIASIDSGQPYWYEVIGVVQDVKAAASLSPPLTRFTIYKPMVQEPWGWTYLVLRSERPATQIEALRRAMNTMDPDLPPDDIATVAQTVAYSQHNLKVAGKMLTLFGVIGLLLAAVGVYGVIANLVAQRTGEFSVRLALGAQPRDVMIIVLRQGVLLYLMGAALGASGAWGLGQFLHSSMPRLIGNDPVAILGVAGFLAVAAFAASWLPARRAMAVDPMNALRDD